MERFFYNIGRYVDSSTTTINYSNILVNGNAISGGTIALAKTSIIDSSKYVMLFMDTSGYWHEVGNSLYLLSLLEKNKIYRSGDDTLTYSASGNSVTLNILGSSIGITDESGL